MKEKKQRRAYPIIITVLAVCLLAALIFVTVRSGYGTKVLTKLGILTPEEEKNWTAVGWSNTLEKLDYDADIVFFGDSITRESDFRKYFPEKTIVNLGCPGDKLKGMPERVSAIAAVKPEKVFILAGINSLHDGNIEECIKEYRILLDALTAALPNAEVFLQSVLPIEPKWEDITCHNSVIVEFNRRLSALAEEYKMTYVDIYSAYVLDGQMNPALSRDGLHLKPAEYSHWAEVIAQYID